MIRVELDAPGEEFPGASRGALTPAPRLQRRAKVGDDGVVRLVLGARLRDRQSVVERDVGASAVDVLGDEPRGGDADVGVSRVEFTRGGEQAERAEAIAAALEILGAPVEVDVRRVRAVTPAILVCRSVPVASLGGRREGAGRRSSRRGTASGRASRGRGPERAQSARRGHAVLPGKRS